MIQKIGFLMLIIPAGGLVLFFFAMAWFEAVKCASKGDYAGVVMLSFIVWFFAGLFMLTWGKGGK